MTPAAVDSARCRSARAEAVKQAWQAGRPADAAAVLAADPELAADRATALDLAYEEFCLRAEAGESIRSEVFCARFPFAASLRRLIAVHRFIDDHPNVLGEIPAIWPAPGDALADFSVVRELGRGGFARVYLGTETTAGNRPVAIKVSAAGSRDADTLGPLSHPHIVPVLSSRRVGAWTVVAMPFAGTATFEDLLSEAWPPDQPIPPRSAAAILTAAGRGGRPDDPEVLTRPPSPVTPGMSYEGGVAAVAAGLADALAYLHAAGVAHRDLKPSNILLGPTGHPYLLDFNLATGSSGAPGRLAGTVPYMAPEQLAVLADPEAAPPADWRPCDVFAFGVILFELLTGRHPFFDARAQPDGAAPAEVAAALADRQRAGHPPLTVLNPRVRRPVRRLIERCLAVDPAARPAAAEVARLLRPDRPGRPSRFTIALLGAVAIVPLSPAVYYLTQGRTWAPSAAVQGSVLLPDNPFDRGVLLVRERGEHALAVADFIKAGKDGNDARAYACAIYCLAFLRNFREAVVFGEQVDQLQFRDAAFFANRAYCYLQTNQLRKAKADCDAALAIDPTLRAARYTRALVHLQLHHTERAADTREAVEDLEVVIQGEPKSAEMWMTAARLYLLHSRKHPGMIDKAVAAIREAVLAGKPSATIAREPLLDEFKLRGHPGLVTALALPSPGPEARANLNLYFPIP